jgi:2-polyprenyl-6-hydroxyphenyl methylase/3-demethylubiquinone-9 3-methyltransferase
MTSLDYTNADPTWANAYLWPEVKKIISMRDWPDRRAFDLGCGNGATANMLSRLGFSVTGTDPSESGISAGRDAYPNVSLHVGDCYQPLSTAFGRFPLVVSLEVIEHCIHPRAFARCIYNLLLPGGLAIISTPYHGYWKNLALAITGMMDQHFTALWDGGHIKFWSIPTLRVLLIECGFVEVRFVRVGRVPPLAKSMIAVATRT